MNTLALGRARVYLAEQQLDAWLVHDYKGTNPVLADLMEELPHATRRVFLLIPATGPAHLLVHAIEATHFAGLGTEVETYSDRSSLVRALGQMPAPHRAVAMEYSPMGQLPTMSWVDGGTLELVRSVGVEVVSSVSMPTAVTPTTGQKLWELPASARAIGCSSICGPVSRAGRTCIATSPGWPRLEGRWRPSVARYLTSCEAPAI